jgi:hypothetical protein
MDIMDIIGGRGESGQDRCQNEGMSPATFAAVTGYEVFVVALASLALIVIVAGSIVGFVARFTRKVPADERPRRRRSSTRR